MDLNCSSLRYQLVQVMSDPIMTLMLDVTRKRGYKTVAISASPGQELFSESPFKCLCPASN